MSDILKHFTNDEEILTAYEETLKPCPFCGNKVKLTTQSYGSGNYGSGIKLEIYCSKCRVSMYGNDVSWRDLTKCRSDLENITNKWNRRSL